MMKKSKLIFWLVVVVVVLALLILFAGESSTGTGNTPFARLDKETIDRIVVSKGSLETIVLVKRTAGWLMTSPLEDKVDSKSIQTALASLVGLEKQRVITNRKEEWPKYRVGENENNINFYASEKLVGGLFLGDLGEDKRGMFARIKGQMQVFLTSASLRNDFTLADTYWRDKTILSFGLSAVERIKYQSTEGNYELTKKDGEWYLGGKKANQQAVGGLVQLLAILTANRFDDHKLSDADYGFDKPNFTLNVKVADQDYQLVIGAPEEGTQSFRYVRLGGQDQVFLLHEGTISRLGQPKSAYLG